MEAATKHFLARSQPAQAGFASPDRGFSPVSKMCQIRKLPGTGYIFLSRLFQRAQAS